MIHTLHPEAALLVVDDLSRHARQQLVKAVLPRHIRDRNKMIVADLPKHTKAMQHYFFELAKRIAQSAKKVKKTAGDDLTEDPDVIDPQYLEGYDNVYEEEGESYDDIFEDLDFDWDPADDFDWDSESDELSIVLRPVYEQFGQEAYQAVAEELAVSEEDDIPFSFTSPSPGVQSLLDGLAAHVTGINDTTRAALEQAVLNAVQTGEGTSSLGKDIAQIFNTWSQDSNSRAEVIALTESANAYNMGSLNAYKDSGLVSEVEVFDGDECGWTEHNDPDLADGSIRDLDDAMEYPESHPNCQRAFGPIAAR